MSVFVRNTPISFLLLLMISANAHSQDLPKKIRGYRLHNENVTLKNDPAETDGKPYMIVGLPAVSDISLSGITFLITAELRSAGYDGNVDLLTFADFTVNGLPVEVREIDSPFRVEKFGKTTLPEPATVFMPTSNVLNAAWAEVTNSKDEWSVTGRIFVFGKFKKFGFNFKRVVPVNVYLKIKNPLLQN